MFWLEFKYFQHKTWPFDKEAGQLTNTESLRKSHVWNEFYSLPYTGVLGFIYCRVSYKTLGIGPCEKSWGNLNNTKTGKRSQLGGESTNKRLVFNNTANIHDARIIRNIMENIYAEGPNAIFGDGDNN